MYAISLPIAADLSELSSVSSNDNCPSNILLDIEAVLSSSALSATTFTLKSWLWSLLDLNGAIISIVYSFVSPAAILDNFSVFSFVFQS